MSNVVVTKKTDYKLKNVCFDGKILVDENGEVIDLIGNLKTIFGEEPFDISTSNTDKVNYTVDYFEENE